ncbi:MAG: helix-turn-helix transcriptional regulator [Prevotella sp.]|nr:helix-turn-helix transcriptional regulator [Prevotella sp.]MDY2702817.1 helix-turn-helix transcriptional regulator [Prevotella sp.]
MKDRIRQLMISQHMTQQSFAEYIGISSASLSSIFNDRTKPTLNTVEAIRAKFPSINLDWLVSGIGSMFKEVSESDSVQDHDQQTNVQNHQSEPSSTAPLQGTIPGFGFQQDQYGVQNNYKNQASLPVQPKIDFVEKKRMITEIRIFFDDQTYESFVPKNSK